MVIGTLIIACIATVAVEVALHWFPWNRTALADQKTGELSPPYTYIAGLLPILIAYTGWLLCNNTMPAWIAAVGIWLITCTAGAAVLGAYQIDKRQAGYWKAKLGDLDGTKGRHLTR